MRHTVVAVSAAWLLGPIATVPADSWIVKLERKPAESRPSNIPQYPTGMSDEVPLQRKVEWPFFTCNAPLYGSIHFPRFGERAGTRKPISLAAALDKTDAKQEAYDVLYIDLDRSGGFGEDERFVAQLDAGGKARRSGTVDFGRIAIPLGSPDEGAMIVCVSVKPTRWGRNAAAEICCYPGTFLEGAIQGRTTAIDLRLWDANMDGSFGNYGYDLISINDEAPFPLSRLFTWGDVLYSFELLPGESEAHLAEYEGEVGRYRVRTVCPPGYEGTVAGVLSDGNGAFLRFTQTDEACQTVPCGSYVLDITQLDFTRDGFEWHCSVSDIPVEISPGRETDLPLKGPTGIRCEVHGVTRPGAKLKVCVELVGQSGEGYQWISGGPIGTPAHFGFPSRGLVRDASGKVLAEPEIGHEGEISTIMKWTMPPDAEDGQEFTFEVTADLGDLGGKVTGTKTITVGQKPDNGGPRYSWSIPKNAEPGDAYNIEVTVDTGPFGGKVTGTKAITVRARAE